MITSFIRGLRPLHRILLFVAFAMIVGGTVGMLGLKSLKVLYGVSLPQDYALLQEFSKPWVVSANKVVLLVQHLGFFVLPGLLFYLTVNGKNFLSTPKLRGILCTVALGVAMYPLINLLAYLNGFIPIGESLMNLEEDAAVFTHAIVRSENLWMLVGNFFLIAVLPAVGEELVFRGIIQAELEREFQKPWMAIILSALVFSSLHMQFAGFIPRFAIGVLLGYLYFKTRNLWYPILVHLANNALALFLVFWFQPSVSEMNKMDAFEWNGKNVVFLVSSAIACYFLIRFMLPRSSSIAGNKAQKNPANGEVLNE